MWFQLQKRQMKKEIKAKLLATVPVKDLVVLKFSLDDAQKHLIWKDANEYSYNNQMYDVVKSLISRDTIAFWCLPDHKETQLNRQLEELLVKVWGHNPQNKKQQKNLSLFFKSLYYSKNQTWQCQFIQNSNQPNLPYTFSDKSVVRIIVVPPPQIG
jgi:hypothetical protein